MKEEKNEDKDKLKKCEYCQLNCNNLNDEDFKEHEEECKVFCFNERIASQFE